jgi:hypothetical protein
MPDRIRKIQVRLAMVEMDCVFVKSAKDQAKIRMTTVRMAVAKLELMCSTPTFASTAVKPAKKADSKAQKNQFMFFPSPETLDYCSGDSGDVARMAIAYLWFTVDSASERDESMIFVPGPVLRAKRP